MIGTLDWSAIPVVEIPLARFVIPLHDIDWRLVRLGLDISRRGEAVHAFARRADSGPVEVSNGRHRLLVAGLRGETMVATRLVVIQ